MLKGRLSWLILMMKPLWCHELSCISIRQTQNHDSHVKSSLISPGKADLNEDASTIKSDELRYSQRRAIAINTQCDGVDLDCTASGVSLSIPAYCTVGKMTRHVDNDNARSSRKGKKMFVLSSRWREQKKTSSWIHKDGFRLVYLRFRYDVAWDLNAPGLQPYDQAASLR
jgi:hypothetical protein